MPKAPEPRKETSVLQSKEKKRGGREKSRQRRFYKTSDDFQT